MSLYMVERKQVYGRVTFAVLNSDGQVVARCDLSETAHLIAALLTAHAQGGGK